VEEQKVGGGRGMEECIFCKIVRGELPSAKVYEDENCLAILDVSPVRPGHTLIMPKAHYATLVETPAGLVQAMAGVFGRLCEAVVRAVSAEGFNLFVANGRCAGQVIDHLHFHIVPRHADDGVFPAWKAGGYAEGEMEKLRMAISKHV